MALVLELHNNQGALVTQSVIDHAAVFFVRAQPGAPLVRKNVSELRLGETVAVQRSRNFMELINVRVT